MPPCQATTLLPVFRDIFTTTSGLFKSAFDQSCYPIAPQFFPDRLRGSLTDGACKCSVRNNSMHGGDQLVLVGISPDRSRGIMAGSFLNFAISRGHEQAVRFIAKGQIA